MFANGPRDCGSIPGQAIPKTQKMVLDASLLNTQHYKVWIKGRVEQSRERNSSLPLHLSVVAIEKGAFRSPSTMVTNFTYIFTYLCLFFSLHSLDPNYPKKKETQTTKYTKRRLKLINNKFYIAQNYLSWKESKAFSACIAYIDPLPLNYT